MTHNIKKVAFQFNTDSSFNDGLSKLTKMGYIVDSVEKYGDGYSTIYLDFAFQGDNKYLKGVMRTWVSIVKKNKINVDGIVFI